LDLTEIILDIAKQGPLVGLLLYLMVRNQSQLDKRDGIISNLHKEIHDLQERSFERLASIKKDSDAVLTALKDAFKG
jgi:hypothetical protein